MLRRQAFSGDKMLVERGDLPEGILFLMLKNEAGAVLANGRVVAVSIKK
jgi:hypothetical protein